LYEVLLYAEGGDAINYAQATHAAAMLINKGAQNLVSVRDPADDRGARVQVGLSSRGFGSELLALNVIRGTGRMRPVL
jgi:hypothetical protein